MEIVPWIIYKDSCTGELKEITVKRINNTFSVFSISKYFLI